MLWDLPTAVGLELGDHSGKRNRRKITADIHLGLNAIRMRVTYRHLTFPPQHD